MEKALGWESVYAFNPETFRPNGTLGRLSERDLVLLRNRRAALNEISTFFGVRRGRYNIEPNATVTPTEGSSAPAV